MKKSTATIFLACIGAMILVSGCAGSHEITTAPPYKWKLSSKNGQVAAPMDSLSPSGKDTLVFQPFTTVQATNVFFVRGAGDEISLDIRDNLSPGTQIEVLARSFLQPSSPEFIYLIKRKGDPEHWLGWISNQTKLEPPIDEDKIAYLGYDSISPSKHYVVLNEERGKTVHVWDLRRDVMRDFPFAGQSAVSGRKETDGVSFSVMGWGSSERDCWILVNFGEIVESFIRIDTSDWSFKEMAAPSDFDSYNCVLDVETGDYLYLVDEELPAASLGGKSSTKEVSHKVIRLSFADGSVKVIATSKTHHFRVFAEKNGKAGYEFLQK